MADIDEQLADEDLELEVEVLSLGLEGAVHLAKMQKLCKAIEKDCEGVPDYIRQIAKLAPTQSSHLERDLHAWCRRQPWYKVLPDTFDFMLPCSLDGRTRSERKHSVLLPHEVYATLWDKAPEVFKVMFGSPEAIADFWNKSDPDWVARHPVLEVQTDCTHATPYGIWGDDSGLFSHDKFLVLHWGGVAQDRSQLGSMGSKIVFGAFEYWSPPIGCIDYRAGGSLFIN